MRNYPKNRKSGHRPNSITQKLIAKFGEKQLYEWWCEYNGMDRTAEHLSMITGWDVSAYVVRYLSYKFNWKRVVTDHNLPFVKAVLNGTVPTDFYKHITIDVPDEKRKQFANGDEQ